MTGAINVRQKTIAMQQIPIIGIEFRLIKIFHSTVVDGVKRFRRLDKYRRIVPTVDPMIGRQSFTIAKIKHGVAQSVRAEADVIIRLEGQHHILHEKVEKRVASREGHHPVFHPAGHVAVFHRADRVVETLQRAQDDAVHVEISAAFLPEQGHPSCVTQVKEPPAGPVERTGFVQLPQRRLFQELDQVFPNDFNVVYLLEQNAGDGAAEEFLVVVSWR